MLENQDEMFLTKDRFASIKSELLDLKQELKQENKFGGLDFTG